MEMEMGLVLDPDQTETHIDIRPLGLTSRMTKTTKKDLKKKNPHPSGYF